MPACDALDVSSVLIRIVDAPQDRLVEEGYNPSYGARPLRRAIMRLLEDSMAERMLSGDIKEGDSVIIDVDADGQACLGNPLRQTNVMWQGRHGVLSCCEQGVTMDREPLEADKSEWRVRLLEADKCDRRGRQGHVLGTL